MQRPTRLVCLRNPPGSVPHLNDFLGGWHRAVRATGIPEVRLPDWPGRAPITSLLTRTGLQRPLPFVRTRALTPMAWASDRDVFPAGFALPGSRRLTYHVLRDVLFGRSPETTPMISNSPEETKVGEVYSHSGVIKVKGRAASHVGCACLESLSRDVA
jgi:hypothetical protein